MRGGTSSGTHVYKLGNAHLAILLPSYDLVGSRWSWGHVVGRDVPWELDAGLETDARDGPSFLFLLTSCP